MEPTWSQFEAQLEGWGMPAHGWFREVGHAFAWMVSEVANLEPTWAQLEPTWSQLGSMLGPDRLK